MARTSLASHRTLQSGPWGDIPALVTLRWLPYSQRSTSGHWTPPDPGPEADVSYLPYGQFWGVDGDVYMFLGWPASAPLARGRAVRMGPLGVIPALTPPW
jgi:hypothetical protein